MKNETVIDVLLTQQGSKTSQLPGAPDLLPRLVELWNSQPEMSCAEEPSENMLASPPSGSLEKPPNSQLDTQETHVDTITRVSQFG